MAIPPSSTTATSPAVGQPDTTLIARSGPGADAHQPATGIAITVPTTMSTTMSATPVREDPTATQHQYDRPSDSTVTDHGAPPTIHTSAVPPFGMTSTMTPTTTNYGFTATLTPLGDDKVNAQKPKQTKKKADGDAPKKPSPRVRTATPKGEKAEKRKASPGRTTPTNSAVPTSTSTSAQQIQSAPPANVPYGGMNGGQDAAQQELPPSQDIELRKTYLQSIYRQLQMTHRNQDDASVRRFATNVEIDICSRSKTKTEYISMMSQQINSLMQAELTNGSVGLQSSLYVPGQGPTSSSGMSQGDGASRSMPSSSPSSSNPSYTQNTMPPAPTPPVQRAPTPTQGSFMSLLSGQGPVQSYDATRQQQFPSPHGRPPQYSGAPSYPQQPVTSSVGMKADPPSASGSSASPQFQEPRTSPSPSMSHAPPEFANRFQHLDRNGLIDLLWTQHKTVLQYQSRVQALETQLNMRANGAGVGMAPQGSSPGQFYNASPRQPTAGSGVPASLSAEAELQRANDRHMSRGPQQPANQYPGAASGYHPSSQGLPTPSTVQNPAQYWEKVRYLKDGYLRSLYIAHQALSQHSAPSNSAQSMKAENVKHNISLACSILSEAPKPMQPRPMDVLESIERFIHTTVVPIVRKVQPQMPIQPEVKPANFMAQQSQYEHPEARSAVGAQLVSQPATEVPNDNADPSVAKGTTKTAGAKGASKAGGKKSPSAAAKKSTPKTTTPKATKTGGKKTAGRANAKQANAATVSSEAPSQINPLTNAPAESEKNPASQDSTRDDTAARSGGMTDDDGLNDFADFADLDFGDDLQDPLSKEQQTKDTSSRKRSIEDV